MDKVNAAAEFVRQKMEGFNARTAVVLGSGLGDVVPRDPQARVVPFQDIPHFPKTQVAGHAGELWGQTWNGCPCYVFRGRVHYYEGHGIEDVVFPIRLMAALGAERVILTNAAGSLRLEWRPGEIALILDHINISGLNPLRGPAGSGRGPRFPDMTAAYDEAMRAAALKVAQELKLPVREGVYAFMPGPSYETPAEIRMLRTLGADLVGMSTVPETIAARQLGLGVLGLSFITNHAAGMAGKRLSHQDVMQASVLGGDHVGLLIEMLLPRLENFDHKGA